MSAVQITPIVPKRKTIIDLKSVLKRTSGIIVRQILDDYKATIATWKKKPRFVVRVAANGYEATISTSNEIYKYVDKGTKPHIIKPKGPWPLRFRTGYRAKTRTRVIGSKIGGATGPEVRAKVVHHPGTEARRFSITIAKKAKRSYKKQFDKEVKKDQQRRR